MALAGELQIGIGVAGATAALQALTSVSNALVNSGQSALQAVVAYERLHESLKALVAKEVRDRDATLKQAEAMKLAAARAEDLLGWTQQLAIQSPFGQQGVAEAFKLSVALGSTTEEAQRITAALIDFAAATGQTEDTMFSLALALGQAKAAGRLMGGEINQMVNAGLGVKTILADAFGVTVAKINQMIEQGLPAATAIEAILQSLEADYGGAAKAQGETFSGLLNSFDDLISISQRKIFQPIFEEARPDLVQFSEYLQSAQIDVQIAAISAQTQQLTQTVMTAAREAMPAVKSIGGLIKDAVTIIGAGLTLPVKLTAQVVSGLPPAKMAGTDPSEGLDGAATAHLAFGAAVAVAATSAKYLIGALVPLMQSLQATGSATLLATRAALQYPVALTRSTLLSVRAIGVNQTLAGSLIRVAGAARGAAVSMGSFGMSAARVAIGAAAIVAPLAAVAIAWQQVSAAYQNYVAKYEAGASKHWSRHTEDIQALKDRLYGITHEDEDPSQDAARSIEQQIVALEKLRAAYAKAAADDARLTNEALLARKENLEIAQKNEAFRQNRIEQSKREIDAELDKLDLLKAQTAELEEQREIEAAIDKSRRKLVEAESTYRTKLAESRQEAEKGRLDADRAYQMAVLDHARSTQDAEREATLDHAKALWEARKNLSKRLLDAETTHAQTLLDAREERDDHLADLEITADLRSTEAGRKRLEAEKTRTKSLLEIERQYQKDRLRAIEDGAEDAARASEAALTTLGTGGADYYLDAEERYRDYVKQKETLAKQGAWCEVDEQREAFIEQERQAAVAYAKQEAQQQAALGRQLIAYVQAQALMHHLSADATNRMIEGVAQTFNVIPTVGERTFGLASKLIQEWAASGGAATNAVVSTLGMLPAQAQKSQLAIEQLTKQLAEQSTEIYAHDGNLVAHQERLRNIPQHVSTQLGISFSGAEAGALQQNLDDLEQTAADQKTAAWDAYYRQINETIPEWQAEQRETIQRGYDEQLEDLRKQHRRLLAETVAGYGPLTNLQIGQFYEGLPQVAEQIIQAKTAFDGATRNLDLATPAGTQVFLAELAKYDHAITEAQARVQPPGASGLTPEAASRQADAQVANAKRIFDQAIEDLDTSTTEGRRKFNEALADYHDAVADARRLVFTSGAVAAGEVQTLEAQHYTTVGDLAIEAKNRQITAYDELMEKRGEVARQLREQTREALLDTVLQTASILASIETISSVQEDLIAQQALAAGQYEQRVKDDLRRQMQEIDTRQQTGVLSEEDADSLRVEATREAGANLRQSQTSTLTFQGDRLLQDVPPAYTDEVTTENTSALTDATTAINRLSENLEQPTTRPQSWAEHAAGERGTPETMYPPSTTPERTYRVSGRMQARGAGGPVLPGDLYLVGEYGPELFIPSRRGTIVPNQAGAVVPQRDVHIHLNGQFVVDSPQRQSDLVQAIRQGVRDELRSQVDALFLSGVIG